MCIPGVSETKAIAIVRIYPTLAQLMDMFLDPKVPEKEKIAKIRDIEVSHTLGDKSKKIGKVLAEKVFKCLMSVDPKVAIN